MKSVENLGLAVIATCLALAEDLCRCRVSPNIRGVGFSSEALLPTELFPPVPVLVPELVGVDGFWWLLVDAWVGEPL